MSFAFTKWLHSNDGWLVVLKQRKKQTLESFLFVLNNLLSLSLASHEHRYVRYTSETPLPCGSICGSYFPLLNVLII